MKQLLFASAIVAIFFCSIISCRKSASDNSAHLLTDSTSTTHQPPVPFPDSVKPDCDLGPDYGDSILYTQANSTVNFYVSPLNNPGAGQYFSWPEGLQINQSTGVINVSKSETGQRYAIGFVPDGTSDTCMHSIILAGSAYMDSIYVLNESDTSAAPYFNANPDVPSPCVDGSGAPGGHGCQFASKQKINGKDLRINNKTGVIDLKRTFINGIFGPLPINGSSVIATINYSLDDNSNNANQSLQVQFIYFNKKSDIPSSLSNLIEGKRNSILNNSLISVTTNPRPPLIIIARFN